MKKINTFLLSFLFLGTAFAQGPVQKYVLLEHFTNSKCSICASRNPAFYNLISQYPDEVHHVAIHPSVPYNTCVFYLANPTENNAWAADYNIFGTPRVAVNGELIPSGTQLLPAAMLTGEFGQTSNLWLQVEESGSGNARTATVKAHTMGALSSTNLKLFVAVVEKTVNQTTSNGESVHHDVFRDMLTETSGAFYLPAPQGEYTEFVYNYTIDAGWNADEIYVLAFVRDVTTGEIINSGTPFDPVVLSTKNAKSEPITLFPNPASDATYVQLPATEKVKQLAVFNLEGRQVQTRYSQTGERLELETSNLTPGLYVLKVTGEQGVYTGKFVKE